MVKLSLVEPNREQPRKHFDEDGLLELAESIKQYGILQPLLVQEKSGYYEIIAGERRWRAAKLAGLKEIPVIVRNLTEQQIVEISLIENIQREDLNPIEEAQAFRRLMEEFHMKQDEIADRVSKSRTAVTNSMRLLKLSKQVQQMVIDEIISTGHARCLISIEDPELQHQLALRIFDETDYLLSNVCCSCKFVFGRSRADAHKLFYAFFKLFELQRTIVKSAWNTESVIDKFGLACKVSSVHCPYLRNCNMGLIDNCQEIIAHEIKQRKRRLSGFSPVKVS